MSQRRTTKKMVGSSEARNTPATGVQATAVEGATVQAEADVDGDAGIASATAELAAEVPAFDARPASDEDVLDTVPSAAMISRYFKLTAAMVGLNVVLASVSVIALLRQPRTIVVAAPPAPAKVTTPPIVPAPAGPPSAATEPLTPAVRAPSTAPALPTSPPPPLPSFDRIPLLGEPASKRILAPPVKAKRTAVATVKNAPVEAADESDAEPYGVHLAERW